MPVMTPDQSLFLEGPNSIAIATQDGHLNPEVTRALALHCLPGGDRVRVCLPARIAERAVANLQVEPRIAVGVNRPTTHQTFQLKGRAIRVGPAPEQRRAEVEAAFARFTEEVGKIGLPSRLLQAVVRWPLIEMEVEIQEIYDQTPGPGAGNPVGKLAG